MLKRLFIWIMLIALPLQGFAAAAMIHCAPAQQASVHMHDGMHHHDDGAQSANPQHQHGGSHQAADKCSACSTCCMGAIVDAAVPTDFSLPPVAMPLPQAVAPLPSIFLEGPQRPPRHLLV